MPNATLSGRGRATRAPARWSVMLGSVKSLYNLVRPQQQRLRDRQAEYLCCLQIDDQLVPGRVLDGQVGGLGALEDLVQPIGNIKRLLPIGLTPNAPMGSV